MDKQKLQAQFIWFLNRGATHFRRTKGNNLEGSTDGSNWFGYEPNYLSNYIT